MPNKFFAKHIGFPLQDRVMKTTILKTNKFLLKSQFWTDEEMSEYKLYKLKKLISYSYDHVPYYRNLFKKNGILPSDINQLADINKIPVLTKELLRSHQKELLSQSANFRNVKKGKTGGTTGTPITTYKDTEERSFTWASYYRWYDWMGISKEDKVLTFWGTPTIIKSSRITDLKNTLKHAIQNNLVINAFNLNESSLPLIYNKLMRFNPLLLKGYLSSIIDLAIYMKSNSLKPNSNLKAISSTTEMLLPMHRELIEDVFKVKMFDQYGCGEVSGIAYECQAHHGMHITEEHVIVETLDEKNRPVTDQTGRITLTSLDNYVMPLIRYQNEDMGTITVEKCNCGVNSQLLSSIEGRSIDTIQLNNGSKVHGVFFTSMFYELGIVSGVISRFQIEQLASGHIDVRLESKNDVSPEMVNTIEKAINKFVFINTICVVKKIPSEPNGKFRYIKSYV